MASLISRTVVFSNGTIEVQPVQKRYKILHDDAIGWDRPKNRPAIVRTFELDEYKGGNYDGANNTWRQTFTEKMQWFWFDLCSLSRFGVTSDMLNPSDLYWLIGKFCGGANAIAASDTFLCNRAGLDTHKNFITGETKDRDPAKIELLLCMGNGNRVLNTLTGKTIQNASGQEMLAFDCIDPTNLPAPSLDLPGVLNATNIYPDLSVGAFRQLQVDSDGCNTPFPLFMKAGIQPYYPVRFLEAL